MKNFKTQTLLVALTLFSSILFAQNTNNSIVNDTSSYPYWIEMMQDETISFFEVQKAFNTYWDGREITKGSGWKPFKRWEWWTERHINNDGTRQATNKVWNEYHKYLKEHPKTKSVAQWENLGPFNVPGDEKGYAGLGRVNAVAFHPTNPNIIFVGAPAGGLWQSIDGGSNWSSTTDQLPTLGVSSIIVDWNNPGNIFIGTGDRDAGDAAGMGVFKSSDFGNTWEIWNNGIGNKIVGRMIQHPNDSQTMFAGTSGGMFKTTDGGENWVLKQSGNFKDVVFKPGSPSIIYAVSGAHFWKSIDTGESWTEITAGLTGGERAVIAVTPADPNVVYFLSTAGSVFKGLYRSANSGVSFIEQSTTPNIMSWGCNGGDGGQAWYDLDIAADPTSPYIIYAGGVNCFKSTDGGINWDINSHWWGDCGVPSVHADLHILEYNPVDGQLYAGNDGGIYRTSNGGNTWQEITDGLPIGQVYRIGQCAIDKDKVINGYQDNGTSTYYGSNNWQVTGGGDGMECAFDHTDPSYNYHTIYYGDIYRKFNNGNQHKVAGNGAHGMNESGGWITPFCLHEGNSDVMFVGMKNIWRADAIKTNSFTWKKLTTVSGNDIDVVEHSPVNYNLFYYAQNGLMYRTDEVMSDNPEWISLTTYLPGSGNVFDIEAHPFNENIIYITRGSKVYISENKGFSWENITGSLPDINMNSLAYYLNSNDGIYVGSDAGIYYRDATMDDWLMYSHDLPVDASVNEIEIYHNPDDPSEDVIRAGTYGRGLWSSPMYQEIPVADFEADQTNVPLDCPINFYDLSNGVPTSWEWTFEGATPSTSNDKNPTDIMYTAQGTYSVSLTVSNSQGTDTKSVSGYITVSESAVPEVYFIASDSITCSGVEIEFTDMSVNCPSAWEWEFSPNTITYMNGTNQNSQDPEVMFNESGTYSVSLTVTNSAGSNSLTKDEYISIGGLSLPFTDDFESGSLNAKSWTVDNPDFNTTWDITSVAGNGAGSHAAFMDLFNYLVPPGPRDRIITPVLSFENFDEAYLSFDYAYAKRHSTVTDSLIVYISDDCGENWHRLFQGGENGNGNFATHELTTDLFVPEVADDWCGSGFGPDCITIDLTLWAGQGNIQIAFESYSHFGNNLYIDNVSIGTMTDIVEQNLNKDAIQVYPNPSNGIFNIRIHQQSGYGNITIFNLQGVEIFNKNFENNATSVQQINLSKLNKGVYFIQYVDESKTAVKKIVVE